VLLLDGGPEQSTGPTQADEGASGSWHDDDVAWRVRAESTRPPSRWRPIGPWSRVRSRFPVIPNFCPDVVGRSRRAGEQPLVLAL